MIVEYEKDTDLENTLDTHKWYKEETKENSSPSSTHHQIIVDLQQYATKSYIDCSTTSSCDSLL
jgi:hypothetical protein